MREESTRVLARSGTLALLLLAAPLAASANDPNEASPPAAQAATAGPPSLDIYGFGQADAIVDFKQNNPDWYDVNRPSRLPSFPNQFGEDGRFYLSPRQSRFGARATLPTTSGDVTA